MRLGDEAREAVHRGSVLEMFPRLAGQVGGIESTVKFAPLMLFSP